MLNTTKGRVSRWMGAAAVSAGVTTAAMGQELRLPEKPLSLTGSVTATGWTNYVASNGTELASKPGMQGELFLTTSKPLLGDFTPYLSLWGFVPGSGAGLDQGTRNDFGGELDVIGGVTTPVTLGDCKLTFDLGGGRYIYPKSGGAETDTIYGSVSTTLAETVDVKASVQHYFEFKETDLKLNLGRTFKLDEAGDTTFRLSGGLGYVSTEGAKDYWLSEANMRLGYRIAPNVELFAEGRVFDSNVHGTNAMGIFGVKIDF